MNPTFWSILLALNVSPGLLGAGGDAVVCPGLLGVVVVVCPGLLDVVVVVCPGLLGVWMYCVSISKERVWM